MEVQREKDNNEWIKETRIYSSGKGRTSCQEPADSTPRTLPELSPRRAQTAMDKGSGEVEYNNKRGEGADGREVEYNNKRGEEALRWRENKILIEYNNQVVVITTVRESNGHGELRGEVTAERGGTALNINQDSAWMGREQRFNGNTAAVKPAHL